MTANWEPTTLGDAADVLTGFPFKSADYSDSVDDIRLLRGDNVAQGRIRWDGVKRWPSKVDPTTAPYLLQPGDVILAMDRPWIEAGLKFAVLQESDCPSLLVQRVACLRSKPGVTQRFLGCIVGSTAFTNYILGTQTGTAVPHISSSQIRNFKFLRPTQPEQTEIANLLGSLDDKIEMNRRMAVTVEAMAQALFKSWLIDFDPVHARVAGLTTGLPAELEALLPNSFDRDNLPRGWTLTPLTVIADFLNGLALQKFPAVAGEDSLPVIKISEMRGGPRSNSGRAAATIPTQYRIENGDHLFSWSGSLTHCLWSHGPGALNQHLFKVTPKAYPDWLAYWAVDHFLPEFQAIAAEKAVTMGHIQRHHLDEAALAMPPRPLLNELSKTFTPLHHRLLSLALEAKTLERLRDTLLPKLISGQLRIDIATSEVAEA
jgi:type I restriction enzyme S subunit